MKILWITNILFPEAKTLISGEANLKASGGWMIGLANSISKHPDIELSIAAVSPLVKTLNISKWENITYYTIPYGKGNIWYNCEYETPWKEVYKQAKPDIVHIHGTEYSHGLAFLKACPEAKVVVSIQGLTSAIHHFYNKGLTTSQIIRNISLRDILRNDNLLHAKKVYKKRGEQVEKVMLRSVGHIIGRTQWDRAHSWNINPDAEYYFCNETLRDEFYTGRWEYDKCEKHTIFLSQAMYPIKGLHMVLEALPAVIQRHPDTKVKIAGVNITKYDTLKDKCSITGYGRIIRSIIHKNKLEKHIEFTGPLNAMEMKDILLKSNVFICPSSIENSPNSLGEAQLLGVPCVASYTGGIPTMIPNENCGLLYNFEETAMLAHQIITTFDHSSDFDNTQMIATAQERHNKERNAVSQITIYKEILSK